VLVVDDLRDSADSISLLLRMLGHQVRVAYDGQSALAIAEGWRPDVAILDIAMPRMDGYELAGRLRAGLSRRDIVLIALTGFADGVHRRLAKGAGFDHYFVKPVSLEVLVASVMDSRSTTRLIPESPEVADADRRPSFAVDGDAEILGGTAQGAPGDDLAA
jgi:CheY-like chemotaxis protein